MSTAAQITANQHNATLSTGPKEGKAAAARNATKHGLSGAFTVLPHEDQDEFDALLACLRDEFHPAGQHESFLVEQMAQARWRLSRARRLETAMFDQMLKGNIPSDDDQRIAAKLLAGGDRALANIQRYANAAERSYYKAQTELLKSQQLRNERSMTVRRPPPGMRMGATAGALRYDPRDYFRKNPKPRSPTTAFQDAPYKTNPKSNNWPLVTRHSAQETDLALRL